MNAVVTPINVSKFQELLQLSNYDQVETKFLVDGFTNGFSLGYTGPRDVKIDSNNLKFRVGNKFDLWDKIMTEVEAKRYVGPFDSPEMIFPSGYIVSPCGLVPKANGRTRMIQHYSYPPGSSVNDFIPDEYSKVKYQDFQDAVKLSLDLLKNALPEDQPELYYSRTEAKNAFRVICIAKADRCLQMLKAENPMTGKIQYFADLCCGFGSSSSCFLYDKISRALRHIYRWKSGMDGIVFLDDALQIGLNEKNCNDNLDIYLGICAYINLPIAEEKTVRATRVIIFLGMILDGIRRLIGLPADKVAKALNQMDKIAGSKNATVLELQRITGLLNFFTRAIVPGRAFTRRLYAAFSGTHLKQHHHVRVTKEIKLDLQMWRQFLAQEKQVLRPFVDFDMTVIQATSLTSDAAKAPLLGYATCYQNEQNHTLYYCFSRWEQDLISDWDPSVQFMELYALTLGVLLFSAFFKNTKAEIFCDNQAVVHMVNNTSSSCKHCMILIRLITLAGLENNIQYVACYIPSEDNTLSDLLSRQKFFQFVRAAPANLKLRRLQVPREMLPVSKFFKDI